MLAYAYIFKYLCFMVFISIHHKMRFMTKTKAYHRQYLCMYMSLKLLLLLRCCWGFQWVCYIHLRVYVGTCLFVLLHACMIQFYLSVVKFIYKAIFCTVRTVFWMQLNFINKKTRPLSRSKSLESCFLKLLFYYASCQLIIQQHSDLIIDKVLY